jgi:hypothetical protein
MRVVVPDTRATGRGAACLAGMYVAVRSSRAARWVLGLVAIVGLGWLAAVLAAAPAVAVCALPAPTTFRLSGTVHAAADVAPAWVVLASPTGTIVTAVDDQRRWALEVAAGDYRIGAARGIAGPADGVTPDITVDGDMDGIALVLDRPTTWDRALPAPTGDALTWIEGEVAGVRDGPVTIEVSTGWSQRLAHRIVRVRGGRYRLAVAGKAWQVYAHRWPMEDVVNERPTADGRAWTDLDLQEEPLVTAFGQVRDERGWPVVGVEVETVDTGVMGEERRLARTGLDGRYVLPVRAGRELGVHHHGRYIFTAQGAGPGPWPLDLDIGAAEEVDSDCFYEPGNATILPPSLEDLARLAALARERAAAPRWF